MTWRAISAQALLRDGGGGGEGVRRPVTTSSADALSAARPTTTTLQEAPGWGGATRYPKPETRNPC